MYEEFKEEYYNKWFQYVLYHPDKPWDYDWLSKNPNITLDIVQNYPNKPWSYLWLSQNPNITWEIVQNNPDKSWDYDGYLKIQI